MRAILVLNGPNLNLLGQRQPDVYGSTTLAQIEDSCHHAGRDLDAKITFAQSNHEGVLLDAIHAAKDDQDGLIINAGAYTHTSIAIMDAISSIEIPTIELHLSNVFARENYRHQSFVAPVSVGVIAGFGPIGYPLAIRAMVDHLNLIS